MHACDLLVKQSHKKEHLQFYISNLGRDRFILRYPWFRKFIPDINWENAELRGPQIKMETIRHRIHQQAQLWLKEKKLENQDNDLTVSTITLEEDMIIGNLTSDVSWTGEHCPSQGIRPGETQKSDNILDEDNIPWAEINRTHTAIEMAHEYAKQHAKEEVTLPKEFQRHAKLFSDKEAKKFPPSQPHNHKIELTAEALAKFNCKLYPTSLADQAIEDKFLDENLEKGYIVPSDSPYGFSTFMVPKKDSDEKRYIINYRPLNAVTKKDVTPLPNLAQCIERLQGNEIFSKFDIRWGYNNVHIKEGNEWKGAFKTRRGLYKPKVMFFGMSNSPPTFQRFINHTLEPFYKKYGREYLQNYMDDCGLGTKLAEKDLHVKMLHYLFDLLAAAGLHLKLSKSIFMQPSMDFLGIRINKNSATIDPAKISGIAEWPEDIKNLKGA